MKRTLALLVIAAAAALLLALPGSAHRGCLGCGPVLSPATVAKTYAKQHHRHHAVRHLSCFICVVVSPPPATYHPASNPFNDPCAGHGGVADAYTEEVTEGGMVYLTWGILCNDGTKIETDRVLIGPAATPDPFAVPGAGITIYSDEQPPCCDDPPPADDGGGGDPPPPDDGGGYVAPADYGSGCDPGDWC